jgi:Flp pilus assembly protein TadD
VSDRPLTEGSWQHARALIDLGRDAEAAQELRRLIASDPDDPSYAAWLALCLVDDEPDQAEVEASRAVSLDPSSPLAFEALARARWGRGDYGGALDAATTLVELAPHDPRAFALLARCAALHGRLRPARDAADTAVQLDPNDPAVWTAKAHVALARHRVKVAELDARRALELDPQHAPALELLSYILMARGRLEESIDVAEGLSHVEPGRPEALRAAKTAAASAVLIALPLGFALGRIVALGTRSMLGAIPAVVIGVGTPIVLLRAVQRWVDRRVERDDPRTALRKLRRATRLAIGAFFLAFALLVGGAWVATSRADRGPGTPTEAVQAQVPAAEQRALVLSGERDRRWGLVEYTGSPGRITCAAFANQTGRAWEVLGTACAFEQIPHTNAKELDLGDGRVVFGVASSRVVGLSVDAPGVEIHGLDESLENAGPSPFVLFFPDQSDATIHEVHEDGSRALVHLSP